MVITFESRKKSYPAYLFVVTYALAALLFEDRWHYLLGFALALGLFLGSYGLGKRLSFLIFKTADQSLYFPIGLGCVLIATFFTGSFSTGRSFLYPIWGILIVLSAFEFPVLAYRINRNYFWSAPFIFLAFWSSFSPSISSNTLEYYSGLAHQYLAIGRITGLPENLYSSFPPFGTTLNVLFACMGENVGIKSFTLLLYFQIISILVSLLRWLITEPVFAGGNGRDQDYQTDLLYMTRMELLVIPLLLVPAIYAIFHEQTFDLLAALFFCAGISSLVKEYDGITTLKLWNIGLLIAFALWTKYSVIVYLPWVVLLWFALSKWRFSKENWKISGLLVVTVLLFWVAVPVRNTIQFQDPFYPLFSSSRWTAAQFLYLEAETMSSGQSLMESLSRFLALVFDPRGIGLVLLVALALYPKARKLRVMNHVLLFGLGCYITWFFIFQDFRQFVPVLLLLFPVCYFSFRHLYIRSPKYLWAVWGICAVVAAIPVMKYFSSSILIAPGQTQKEFLNSQVDYYGIAGAINQQNGGGQILLLGENRIAYYEKRVTANSRYDASPVLSDMRSASSAEELYRRFHRRGIRFVIYNETGFHQTHGPQGLFPLTELQQQQVQKLLTAYSKMTAEKGTVRLYELSDVHIW